MFKATTFYKFFPIPKSQLTSLSEKLQTEAEKENLKGLILISEEGINTSLVGQNEQIDNYKKFLITLFPCLEINIFKDSTLPYLSFKRMRVKIKEEIVPIGKTHPHLPPVNQHICPEEWDKKIQEGAQILDVRNNYEIEVGKFKHAFDLNLSHFRNFAEKLKQASLDKNKKTLIYCTGGIRCEKALEVMKKQGFREVYQLEGGIINYFKKKTARFFEGECFVFDHRVALKQDGDLSEKYGLCPHCGQAGDIKTTCLHCSNLFTTCKTCLSQETFHQTCSKNCRYHFKQGHVCKKTNSKNLRKKLL